MGVYIKGMEMPQTGLYLISVDNTDGKDKTIITVMKANDKSGMNVIGSHELISVPDHGRLIDADELRCLYDPHDYGLDGEQADEYDRYHVSLPVIRQNIDDMPTIIEAEGKE